MSLKDSTVDGNVYGAYAKGTAKDWINVYVRQNAVTVDSSTVTGNVYGGFTENGTRVTNSSVTLKNAVVTGTVYGGYGESGPINTSSSRNTIAASGVNTVGGLDGYVTLDLAAGGANAASPVITVNGTANLSSKTINVSENADDPVTGTQAILIKSNTANGLTLSSTKLVKQGTFATTTWQVNQDSMVEVTRVIEPVRTATGNTKTLPEAMLGASTLIN